VPRISVITRKAYGGAYVVMDSKSIGSDLAYAFPSAELAVMGAQGAVEIVHRRALAESDDPEALRAQFVEEYEEEHLNPWEATNRGYIDAVIDPADLRHHLISGMEVLRTKREELPNRKHGNIPL
jgi:acetyl-CoA carboxylase carboxyltransferase component